MKVMTYNILIGGLSNEVIKKGPRTLEIHDVIRQAGKEQPLDFLAVQEAEHFDKQQNNLLNRMQAAVNLPYAKLSKTQSKKEGLTYPVATFSKYPFKEQHHFRNKVSRGALLTRVDCELGDVAFCNLHLTSFSEDDRLEELEVILTRMQKYKKSIIMGDFNSLSWVDRYDKSIIPPKKYRFEVAAKMRDEGFTDVAEYCQINGIHTFPSPIVKGLFEDESLRRLDYIWVSPSLQSNIKRAGIIQTEKADLASDHYPTWVILE